MYHVTCNTLLPYNNLHLDLSLYLWYLLQTIIAPHSSLTCHAFTTHHHIPDLHLLERFSLLSALSLPDFQEYILKCPLKYPSTRWRDLDYANSFVASRCLLTFKEWSSDNKFRKKHRTWRLWHVTFFLSYISLFLVTLFLSSTWDHQIVRQWTFEQLEHFFNLFRTWEEISTENLVLTWSKFQ